MKIDSLGFLPDESDRRSADLLIIPSALCRQSSWHFLPRIAIDFAVVSPFRITRGRKAIEDYATTKKLNQATYATPDIEKNKELDLNPLCCITQGHERGGYEDFRFLI